MHYATSCWMVVGVDIIDGGGGGGVVKGLKLKPNPEFEAEIVGFFLMVKQKAIAR
jgi:hypothetical protein